LVFINIRIYCWQSYS